MDFIEERNEIAVCMRRLYAQDLTTTSGGNISLRLPDGNILMTPSASDKGRMQAEEIGLMEYNGKALEVFKPSIESRMHLSIYQAREEVMAIVHAHPVTASAFAAGTAEINCRLISESYAILGHICYAPYHTMGSDELAAEIKAAAKSSDCIVMRNHGVVTLGLDLLQAFDRMEILEAAARMTIITENFLKDETRPLPQDALAAIDHIMGRS